MKMKIEVFSYFKIFFLIIYIIFHSVFTFAETYFLSETNEIKKLVIEIEPGLVDGDYIDLKIEHVDGSPISWDKLQAKTLFKVSFLQRVKIVLFEEMGLEPRVGATIEGNFRKYLKENISFLDNQIMRFTVSYEKSIYEKIKIPIPEYAALIINGLKFHTNSTGEIQVLYRTSKMQNWRPALSDQYILISAESDLGKPYRFFVESPGKSKVKVSFKLSIDRNLLLDKKLDMLRIKLNTPSQNCEFMPTDTFSILVNGRVINQKYDALNRNNIIFSIPSEKLKTGRKSIIIELSNIDLKIKSSGLNYYTIPFNFLLTKYAINIPVKKHIFVEEIAWESHPGILIFKTEERFKLKPLLKRSSVSDSTLRYMNLTVSINKPFYILEDNTRKSSFKVSTLFAPIYLYATDTTSKFASLTLKSPSFDNTIEKDSVAWFCKINTIKLDKKVFTQTGENSIDDLFLELGGGKGIPINSSFTFSFNPVDLTFKSEQNVRLQLLRDNKKLTIPVEAYVQGGKLYLINKRHIPPFSDLYIEGLKFNLRKGHFKGKMYNLLCNLPGNTKKLDISQIYPVKINSKFPEHTEIVPFINDTNRIYSLGTLELSFGPYSSKIFNNEHSLLMVIKYEDSIKWIINRYELRQSSSFFLDVDNIETINPNTIRIPFLRKIPDNTVIKLRGLGITNLRESHDNIDIFICYDDVKSVLSEINNPVKIRSPDFSSSMDQYVEVNYQNKSVFGKYYFELNFSDIPKYASNNHLFYIEHDSKNISWDESKDPIVVDEFCDTLSGIGVHIDDAHKISLSIDPNDPGSLKRKFIISNLGMKLTGVLKNEDVQFRLYDENMNLLQIDPKIMRIRTDPRDKDLLINRINEKLSATSSGNYFILKTDVPTFDPYCPINVDTKTWGISDSTINRYPLLNHDSSSMKILFDKGIIAEKQRMELKDICLLREIGENDIQVLIKDNFGFHEITPNLKSHKIIGQKIAKNYIKSLRIKFNVFELAPSPIEKLEVLRDRLVDIYENVSYSESDRRKKLEELDNLFLDVETMGGKDWWEYWWCQAYRISLDIQLRGESGSRFNSSNRTAKEEYDRALNSARRRGWSPRGKWTDPPRFERIPSLISKFKNNISRGNYMEADNNLMLLSRTDLRAFFDNFGYPDFKKGSGGKLPLYIFYSDLYYWRAKSAINLGDLNWALTQLKQINYLGLREGEFNEARDYEQLLDSLTNQMHTSNRLLNINYVKTSVSPDAKKVRCKFQNKTVELTDILITSKNLNRKITYGQNIDVNTSQDYQIQINDSKSLIKTNMVILSIGCMVLIWANL